MPVYFPGNGLPAGVKPIGGKVRDGRVEFDHGTRSAIASAVATQSQYVERIRDLTLIDGISLTNNGGGATLAIDGATLVDGKPSLHFSSNNITAFAKVLIDISSYGRSILPDERRDIGLAFRVKNAAGRLSNINVYVGSSATMAHSYLNSAIQTPGVDGDYYVPLYHRDFNVAAGSPNGLSMKFVQFNVTPLPGNATGAGFEIEFLELVRFKPRKPRIFFSYDDGHESCALIADMMEKRGLPSTYFVYTDGIGQSGNLTISQLRDLNARSHDIAVHNRTHESAVTLGDVPYLAGQLWARDWIRDSVGGRAADHAAFVGGHSTPELITMMYKARFLSARAAAPAGLGFVHPGWGTSETNLWRNPRWRGNTWEMNNLTTLEQMKTRLLQAIDAGMDFYCYGHQAYAAAGPSAWSYLPGDAYSMPDLFDFTAQLVAAGEVEPVTVSQLWT